MFFLLKSAFLVGLVYFMLPEQDRQQVVVEAPRAIAKEPVVKATMERAQQAAGLVVSEGKKLCVNKGQECLDAAAQVFLGQPGGK